MRQIQPRSRVADSGRTRVSRILLSGNEAIARGAWEAGAAVGVGYPGTPSTETLETLVKLPGCLRRVGAEREGRARGGARESRSAAPARSSTMKHVGLNVAADPLFTLAYTGVARRARLLVADDPGMHSSQNEQDSRNYGAFAQVPCSSRPTAARRASSPRSRSSSPSASTRP